MSRWVIKTARALIGVAVIVAPPSAYAHGESVRGAGSSAINTIGGAIAGAPYAGLRYDYRSYSLFTDAELIEFRARGEDVHQHSAEHSLFLTVGVPLAKNVDLAFVLQGNQFRGFKDNGDEYVDASCPIESGAGETTGATPDACISTTRASTGLGDLVVIARWRLLHRGDHHLAGIFGVIVPTGGTRNRVDKVNPATGEREIVGTHNQPGSGAFSAQLGLAHTSTFFGSVSLSFDALARINGGGAWGFRQGSGGQLDLGLSYGKRGAYVTPVLELNAIFQLRDVEDGAIKENSGGSVLYVSPGIAVQVRAHQVYFSFSYPAWQDLGGISNLEAWRLGVGYGLSFDFVRERRHRREHQRGKPHRHTHERGHEHPSHPTHRHDERSPDEHTHGVATPQKSGDRSVSPKSR